MTTEHRSSTPRQLPLRALHQSAGARMMPFAGWEMPLQYEGIVAEHEAVRSRAAVFDVSHMGRVEVRGSSAGRALRSVTTFDVTTMEPGETHYSLYCNEAGGIDDDVIVARIEGDRWLVVHNAANALAGEQRLAALAGVDVRPAPADSIMLAVQGPEAVAIASHAMGRDFEALPVRHCLETAWEGTPLFASRTGYTGEDGLELVVAAQAGERLWQALIAGGAVPAGLGARETLRLEAALPLHGHEITAEITPYEAGLGWAITLDDGADFTGRTALARLAATEPARKRVHLRLRERGVPREGYAILDRAGTSVGALTSGVFSPTLRAGIGMGYVPAELAVTGTELAVQVREHRIAADVVRRPFYRRQDEKR